MDNAEIGARVRQWRLRRGLTRRQFAERVGRSPSWVDKIESGERALVRLPMLEQVAEALGIRVETLTGTSPTEPHRSPLDAVDVSALRTALQRVSPSPACMAHLTWNRLPVTFAGCGTKLSICGPRSSMPGTRSSGGISRGCSSRRKTCSKPPPTPSGPQPAKRCHWHIN